MVKITIDDAEHTSWKQYSDFEALANACCEYTQACEKMKRYLKGKKQSQLSSSSYRRKGIKLDKTISAWTDVKNNRPWFFQQLGIASLSKELRLLATFLKALLFEIPCLQLLVQFMNNDCL